MNRLSAFLDHAMDQTVAPGFSRVGIDVRRRLPEWPPDPAAGALNDRLVVITGASSGIGLAASRQAAQLGATVYLVVRDELRGNRAADRLASEHGLDRARLVVRRCDLSDLDQVRSLAELLLDNGTRVHGLVHCAGALPQYRMVSTQGHELTMAVHVLGPMRLSQLLAEAMDQDSRVVFVSSGGMYTQSLPVDDPEYLSESYSGTKAYARSKRVQVELAPLLAGILPAQVYVMHPGWVDTAGLRESLPRFHRVVGPLLRDPGAGADTVTWLLASQPAPRGEGIWMDRQPRPVARTRTTRATETDRKRMWEWVSEQVNAD